MELSSSPNDSSDDTDGIVSTSEKEFYQLSPRKVRVKKTNLESKIQIAVSESKIRLIKISELFAKRKLSKKALRLFGLTKQQLKKRNIFVSNIGPAFGDGEFSKQINQQIKVLSKFVSDKGYKNYFVNSKRSFMVPNYRILSSRLLNRSIWFLHVRHLTQGITKQCIIIRFDQGKFISFKVFELYVAKNKSIFIEEETPFSCSGFDIHFHWKIIFNLPTS